MSGKFTGTLVLLFILVSGAAYALSRQQPGFDLAALLAANAIMLLLTLVAFRITRKSLQDRPQAFIRGVFSGTLLKMFVVIGLVVGYALVHKAHLYKPLIFAFMGIYAVYTAAETWLVSGMAKKAGQ